MRAIFTPTGRALRLALMLAVATAIAGCSSIPAPKLGPGPPAMVTPKSVRTLGPAPVTGEEVRFAFATVSGVPAEMRFRLEDSLKSFAATRGLGIVPEGDPSAIYKVKGYLSAVGDSSGTLLVYTWDVSDVQGTALHRISGQETAGGSAADPWLGIGKTQIDDAARETVDRLAEWVRRR